MARAFIVEGSTGEYSDHCDWPVAVFTSRGRAARFTARANQWLRENGFHTDDCTANYQARGGVTCPFDPNFRVDYTGTEYDVVSTALNPELPR